MHQGHSGSESSAIPHQGLCAPRTSSCRLYEHRNDNEVEPTAKHKERLGNHRPFYEILPGIHYKGSKGQNCHANTV